MAEEKPLPNSLPNFGRLPWDDLYPRLLLAALGKIRRMVWMGKFRGHVPGGRTPHDAVHTAIEKLMSGERQWNWSKSAYENLWGAVSSEISNWGTSAGNKLTELIEDEKVIQLPTNRPSPEDVILWRSERNKLLEHLRTKDLETAQMAEFMLDQDLSGSEELAKAMGLERHKIDALKRRLKRLAAAYLDDANKGDPEAVE